MNKSNVNWKKKEIKIKKLRKRREILQEKQRNYIFSTNQAITRIDSQLFNLILK